MDYCVYYDKNNRILEYLPTNIDAGMKSAIDEFWGMEIPRKILIFLSEKEETTIPQIKKEIGHSMSTLHENIAKLEQAGLLESKITYISNKKKTIRPKVLFVTKNPKFAIAFRKFFQGAWIDSSKNKKISDFLQKNPGKYYSIEQISAKVKIPVDEIEILLNNWESLTTRTLSNFMQEKPFEKKVLYKGKKMK